MIEQRRAVAEEIDFCFVLVIDAKDEDTNDDTVDVTEIGVQNADTMLPLSLSL